MAKRGLRYALRASSGEACTPGEFAHMCRKKNVNWVEFSAAYKPQGDGTYIPVLYAYGKTLCDLFEASNSVRLMLEGTRPVDHQSCNMVLKTEAARIERLLSHAGVVID